MRIVQISDTHLSAEHGHFRANAEALADWLKTAGADLVINTGDLSMNGAVSEADLLLARDWHAGLGLPVLSVPGNHDVGDRADIRPDQPLDDARLKRFRGLIGPDRWLRDIAGWRLIGLNAMLLGTGHAEEEAQYAWLEEALATSDRLALFLHKPLFIDAPDEGPRGYWSVVPDRRRRLFDLMRGRAVKLVASGHLHIVRTLELDGVSHVWGPAASFVVGALQEPLGGERRLGAVVHDFSDDTVVSRFVYPDGMTDLELDPVHDLIYPPAEVVA